MVLTSADPAHNVKSPQSLGEAPFSIFASKTTEFYQLL